MCNRMNVIQTVANYVVVIVASGIQEYPYRFVAYSRQVGDISDIFDCLPEGLPHIYYTDTSAYTVILWCRGLQTNK